MRGLNRIRRLMPVGALGGGGGAREINAVCPAITPTLGATLLSNGGMELWADENQPTNWPKSLAGTSQVVREDVVIDSGTYAARLDVDASNSSIQIQQTIVNVIGDWIYVTAKIKTSVAGKSLLMGLGTVFSGAITPGTEYVVANVVLRAAAANHFVLFRRNATSSSSIYIDTVEAQKITFASCLTYLGSRGGLDGAYQFVPTVAAGQAGLAIGYKDENNLLLFYVNRTDGKLYLDQRDNGTWSNLSNAAITYVDGVVPHIVISGTTAKLHYDGAQVGLDATITAAGLGTQVHGFSTFATNAVGQVATNFI